MKQLLSVFVLFLAANAAPAADLLAVYQRALQNDPQLREAEATRLAALEAKPQALSALLPQLAGNALVSKERDVGSQNTTQSVQLPPCGSEHPRRHALRPGRHARRVSSNLSSLPAQRTPPFITTPSI